MQDGEAASCGQAGVQNASAVSSGRSRTRTPGMAASRAPCPLAADGTIAVTANP